MTQFGLPDSNDNVFMWYWKKKLNCHGYRIVNENEACRHINERRTNSVNISSSFTSNLSSMN